MKNKEIVVGQKIGMTQIFTKKNILVPVSLIYIPNNIIIDIIKKENYYVIKILILKEKYKNINPIICNKNIKNINVAIKEIHVSKTNMKIGDKININSFKINEHVDITGITIGKGFCGVIKKYNFKGLEASHGVSKSHRSLGSTGQCQDPGKVFKGKKMAGHLGNVKKTMQNLTIINIDQELNILVVKGSIPGHKNNQVYLKHSLKKNI